MNLLASILAQSEDGLSNLLYIALFLLISLASVISQKVKEKREKEQAARQREQMRQGPTTPKGPAGPAAQPPQPRPADQAVEAMREALRQRQTIRRPPPLPAPRRPAVSTKPPMAARPAHAPSPRPALQTAQAPSSVESLAERHVVPSATGSEVDQEIAHLRLRLEQAEQLRRQRMSESVGTFGTAVAIADERHGGEEIGAALEIDLIDPETARRGIVLAEVIGAPVAIRDEPPGWRAM